MPRRKKVNKPKANIYMYVSSRTKGRTSLRIIVISLVAIFFVVIGLMIVTFLIQQASIDKKIEINKEPIIQQKEEKTEKEPEPKIIIPEELFNLSGIIQEVKSNSIIFSAKVPYLDELGMPAQRNESREAIISEATEFKKMSIIAKEGTNKKAIQEVDMNFGDLKIGDYIEVIARKNIKDLKEFEVAKVRIMQ
ncbi:MAG: hypothetical protein ABIA02_03010 [Candidatus Falkowbacteria bacterium]